MSDHNLVDKVAGNNIWLTPDDALDPVRAYAPIGLDPCTEAHNPVGAKTFFTEEDDGLAQSWQDQGLVFVNPPYSTLSPLGDDATTEEKREAKRVYMESIRDKAELLFGAKRADVSSLIVLWAMKIHAEVSRGVELIALLPCGARYSTNYWQDHILVDELRSVCWVRGRIKFINGQTGLPGKGNNYDSKFYGFNVDQTRFGAAFKRTGEVFAMQRHRAGVLDGFI
jgi:phage N-6-adenine-methyltransferase